MIHQAEISKLFIQSGKRRQIWLEKTSDFDKKKITPNNSLISLYCKTNKYGPKGGKIISEIVFYILVHTVLLDILKQSKLSRKIAIEFSVL